MPKITTRRGNTYNTDSMCDGSLLSLAADIDADGDPKLARKVMDIRDRRMKKARSSCSDSSCC
ncbi:hypothetical protein [Streptomyces filamentosus]|uniref:hypothetical protein n=1 Tax=Streptomyces filamentosus TaxID=67294 RepID=UPI00123A9355|nr:hypothetical protein [Streptomyces filamentosus]KAA6216419.1 hypothetical protein CP979_05265 [Streptomyces filamentosus]